MKILTIFMISICFAACSNFEEVTEHNSQSVRNIPKTEFSKQSSVFGGFYIVHKIKDTEIRDGVEVDFYNDGKVKTIINYENGSIHGIWIRLNRDGTTCFRMIFDNDKPVGNKVCNNGKIGDFYTLECGCDL